MRIELKHISKNYGRKSVLKDVSITAESGMCIGILGGNGCGKSTLLSVLSGIRKASSGSFTCDGVDMLRDRKLRSKIVGYVPQGTPLVEELSARDNLLIFYLAVFLFLLLKALIHLVFHLLESIFVI